jgi:endonuclease YncB( thermonuclease family)
MINLELVQLGFARAWAYPPDTKYQTELSSAQTQAKKSLVGLWKACQK